MNTLAEENGQLMYRFAEYDEVNEEYVENTNNPLQTSYENAINSEEWLFFYYVEENGEETPISASDLTVSDEDMIMLMEHMENEYMTYVGAAGFGTGQISYENNGVVSSVDVVIALPEVGISSDKIASADTFIDEFTLTDTDNTFYVATTGDWKLTEVVLEEDLEQIAEVTISEDKTYATITITDAPAYESWSYTIQCSAEDSSHNTIERELSVWIESEVPILEAGLKYRLATLEDDTIIEDTEAPLWSSYGGEPGDKEYVWFYYVENEEETVLTISDLTSSNEDVVKISEDASGAILIEMIEEGSATIDYVYDGITYSVDIEVDIWVKDVAFYLENTADSADYIEEFTVTDAENTFYLVANNDWSITEVILDEEFAEIAEAAISEDGAYAVITITGTPEDGYAYGLDCTLTDSEGDTLTTWETITLNNQRNSEDMEDGTLPPAGEDSEEDSEEGTLPPTEDDTQDNTQKPSEKPDKESPNTGKGMSVWVWVSVFAVACMTTVIVMREKKKS